MDWELIYRDLRRLNWFTLLIMSVISTFAMGHALTLGIILGGLIIMGNFHLLQHTIRRGFSPEGRLKARKTFVILKYYFRLLALGILIAILIKRGWVHPVGLALGLSTVVISIAGLGIKRALRPVNGEAA